MEKTAIFLVMKITFLSDKNSWKNQMIAHLAQNLRRKGHKVGIWHRAEQVKAGDLLFILGFFKIVPASVLKRNKTNLVVHESALPKGRGWSPITWQVLEGSKIIPLTLFEAVENVDAGAVYLRDQVKLKGNELLPEIQEKVRTSMMGLCWRFVQGYPSILSQGKHQTGKPTYYPRRKPEDSRLNLNKTLASQFNLLRTVDNASYPAFFTHKGVTYLLKIEKTKN